MGRNTYQTCEIIMREVSKQVPGNKISRKGLDTVIKVVAGTRKSTLRRYRQALHEFGFIEPGSVNDWKILKKEGKKVKNSNNALSQSAGGNKHGNSDRKSE